MPVGTTPLDFVLLVNSWQLQAISYKTAADKLVEDVMAAASPVNRGDFLFPVGFLYRHYLELMLKNLVRGGASLGKISKPKDALEDHNLHKLWNNAKTLLDDICDPADQKVIKSTKRLVLQYHAVDSSSCAFRYPERNNGGQFLDSLPTSGNLVRQLRNLDLAGLRNDIHESHEFLDRICDLLNASFDDLIDVN